jgi:hypothetical protein
LTNSGKPSLVNCLFLNARNKQTVPQVAGPLREIGIPAAMIVDIDVLKDGGREWSRLLDAASVPETSRDALNSHRAAVKRAFEATNMDMKRDGGLCILERDARESCNSLFAQLAEYGIFVVPGGEVESWLPEFGATGHSPEWLIQVFERMGDNPRDHPAHLPCGRRPGQASVPRLRPGPGARAGRVARHRQRGDDPGLQYDRAPAVRVGHA